MDHDDAFAKLDEVPEGQSEAPGQLLDAGEGLDSWVRLTAALLLLFKTHEKLQKREKTFSIYELVNKTVWLKCCFMMCTERLYLLQRKNQRPSTFYLIHLSGPAHRLLDDVSKVVKILGTKRENQDIKYNFEALILCCLYSPII